MFNRDIDNILKKIRSLNFQKHPCSASGCLYYFKLNLYIFVQSILDG